jgi:hypothetical protein
MLRFDHVNIGSVSARRAHSVRQCAQEIVELSPNLMSDKNIRACMSRISQAKDRRRKAR